MSKVLTKFEIVQIIKTPVFLTGDSGAKDLSHTISSVELRAVQDEIFGPHTPSGSIVMNIHNEAAAKVFEKHIGDEFEVRFTPKGE